MLTLRSLALRAVQITFRHNWNLTNVLPVSLQRELLLLWLRCEESIPTDDEDLNKIFERIPSNWCDSRPVCAQTFVDLMSLSDDEVPHFCDELNHVVYDYIVQCFYGSTIEKSLCEICYIKLGKPYLPYSANYWFDQGWYFKRIKAHEVVHAENILMNVIWNADNWCKECVTEPLFDIKDEWNCEMDTDFHRKTRRISDSDDEDSIIFSYTNPIVGNKIDDVMYNFVSSSR